MAEWSKASDSSSGPRERAWVQIPLLTEHFHFNIQNQITYTGQIIRITFTMETPLMQFHYIIFKSISTGKTNLKAKEL
ncbi:hypothetical protein AAZX31_17G069100 [Glycine max]